MSEAATRLRAALDDAFDATFDLLPDGRIDRGDGYRILAAPSFPFPLTNAVWVDGPDERPALRDLERSLDDIRSAGVSPAVITIDQHAPGVEAEARRLGLTSLEPMSGMVLMREGFREPTTPTPELVLVGDDAELLEVAKDVTARGFEVAPEVFEGLFATGLRMEGLDLWLAYVDDAPVSTALGIARGDAVGIFDVATPPEHRRRGYGAWATAGAVRAGFERGASFAYLQATEMGFGIYERLGFDTVCQYRIFTEPHADDAS